MAGHSTPTHDDHFEESEAKEHMAEDSEAWNGVTGLLIFIVSIGLILATLTLYLSRNP